MTDQCKVLPGKEQSSECCRSAPCHAALRLTRVATPFSLVTCTGISKRRNVSIVESSGKLQAQVQMHAAKCRQAKRLRLTDKRAKNVRRFASCGAVLFCCDYHTRTADFSTTTPSLAYSRFEP